MATNLDIMETVSLRNGLLVFNFAPGASGGLVQITQTTARLYDAVHTIGTSEESISAFGDVVAPTLVWMYNLSSANFVDWGFATTVYGAILKASWAPTRITWKSGATLFLKADTAACDVRIIALET